MDWQHFKEDVFNGLVSGVTVLLVLGTGGKAIFEHWFNRRLKQYEIELNEKSAKEKARFESTHLEKTNAAKEIYKMAAELTESVTMIALMRIIDREDYNPALIANTQEAMNKLPGRLIALHRFIADRQFIFEPSLLELINNLSDYISIAIDRQNVTNKEEFQTVKNTLSQNLKNVESAFRELFGVQGK